MPLPGSHAVFVQHTDISIARDICTQHQSIFQMSLQRHALKGGESAESEGSRQVGYVHQEPDVSQVHIYTRASLRDLTACVGSCATALRFSTL
jgi:hypothetical protein